MIGLIAKIGRHIGGAVIPYEDLLTFTEVDSDGDITITKYVATWETMSRQAASYVAKDYGAGYFGDFDIEWEAEGTVQDALCSTIIFGLANAAGTFQDFIDNNVGVTVHINDNNSGTAGIKIQEYSLDNSDYVGFDPTGTLYYYKITRVGTTFTCYVYSDSDRTVLVDSIVLTGPTTKYRYLHALASRDLGVNSADSSGYTQNFNINPNNWLDLYQFTSVDENSDFTIDQFKIDVSSMRRDAVSYNYYDYGADYFGNFEIQFEAEVTATGDYANFNMIGVVNQPGTRKDHLDNNNGMSCQVYGGGGDNLFDILINCDITDNSDSYQGGGAVFPQMYYFTFKRVSTTLYLYIYSDSDRTVLVDTLSCTCSATTLRYLQVAYSRENTSSGANEASGYVQNVKIITAS